MIRFVCICLCLAAAGASWAQGENPLRIGLVSESTAVVPGRPFYLGLHLEHRSGDHTYWKCPGIVGVPTGIEWDLPAGFEAAPIEWPGPQRVFM